MTSLKTKSMSEMIESIFDSRALLETRQAKIILQTLLSYNATTVINGTIHRCLRQNR